MYQNVQDKTFTIALGLIPPESSKHFTAPPIVNELEQADGLVSTRIAICTVPEAVWHRLFWRKVQV
jgi:hypothetical protein